MLNAALPAILAGLGGGLLLLAALSDLRRFEIPDALSIGLALLALLHLAVLPDGFLALLPARLGGFALVFAAGVLLFALGVMGGGDVKLLSALALWTSLAGLPRLLLPILFSGGVLAIVLLAARWLAAVVVPAGRAPPPLLARGAPLPYAVAIFAGTAFWAVAEGLLAVP